MHHPVFDLLTSNTQKLCRCVKYQRLPSIQSSFQASLVMEARFQSHDQANILAAGTTGICIYSPLPFCLMGIDFLFPSSSSLRRFPVFASLTFVVTSIHLLINPTYLTTHTVLGSFIDLTCLRWHYSFDFDSYTMIYITSSTFFSPFTLALLSFSSILTVSSASAKTNDWSVPCFQGRCAYDLVHTGSGGGNSTSSDGGANGSLQIVRILTFTIFSLKPVLTLLLCSR